MILDSNTIKMEVVRTRGLGLALPDHFSDSAIAPPAGAKSERRARFLFSMPGPPLFVFVPCSLCRCRGDRFLDVESQRRIDNTLAKEVSKVNSRPEGAQ